MPYRLDTHMLTVDANAIHKVDTGNLTNLCSMWTVFSRCADSLEQGRRLENLSWRLWQREQLIENAHRSTSLYIRTTPKNIPSDTRLPELPQLSGSVESIADDETIEFTSVSVPLEIRPRIRRLESSASRRDRHISSDDFEKMVVSIVKDKAPLSAPSHTSPLAAARKEIESPLQWSGSTSTESQASEQQSEESQSSPNMEPMTVAQDISNALAPQPIPNTIPTASIDDSIPNESPSPAPKFFHSKKQPAFAFGASCSSSEFGQSVEVCKPKIPSKNVFQSSASSEEEVSLTRPLSSTRPTTSRKTETESAVDTETEGEDLDESAVSEEEDSEWEDSNDESGKHSVDEKFFQRVESKVNLTSRPSLITLMLAQSERATNLGNHASQSTSAIPRSCAPHHGPSLGGSPNDSDEGPLMMKGRRQTLKSIIEAPRSSAQPIAVAANYVHAQAALSPRTTRRNMLATELTESLRRHLLWERQQKSSTVNAVLKRRHTSHDVANLKQYPDKPCMKQSEDVNASSWNQYFAKEAFNGYHSKGW